MKQYTKKELDRLDTESNTIQPDSSDNSIFKINGFEVYRIVDLLNVYLGGGSSWNYAVLQTSGILDYHVSADQINIAYEFNRHYRSEIDRDRATRNDENLKKLQQKAEETKQKETMKQQPEEETFDISIVKKAYGYRPDDLKKVTVTKTQLEQIKNRLKNRSGYAIVTYAEDVTDETMQECFPLEAKVVTVEISEHYNGETVVKSEYADFNNFICRMM